VISSPMDVVVGLVNHVTESDETAFERALAIATEMQESGKLLVHIEHPC